MPEELNLPRQLPEGLTLRWATREDTEKLAEFNIEMHTDNPDQPEVWLGGWTRALMGEEHPTTRAEDFTIVEDASGRVVSSLCLIPQTWVMGDISFGVGQVELVATLPDYRRRGLVRLQMDVIHAHSTAKGHLVQMILGIPWYYRQFGYEMAVDVFGGRLFNYDRRENDKAVKEEAYQWRPATTDDIPYLAELYRIHCRAGLVSRWRDSVSWTYELAVDHGPNSPTNRHFRMIEDREGVVVGYAEFAKWEKTLAIRELAVRPGHSLRAVSLFLTRALRQEMERMNEEREKTITRLSFHLGVSHPAYEALGRQLDRPGRAYGLYLRVPDMPAFLRHLTPLLEKRLAESVMAGHSGKLRLNFFRDNVQLTFDAGQVLDIAPYTPKFLDEGDAVFPNLTFLQLLFGRATLWELNRSYADCYAGNVETEVLLNILFPKIPSNPALFN